MTDPDVIFDKEFKKLEKELDKNLKDHKELTARYVMLRQQWIDLLDRRAKNVNS